jgi:uncharacterized membrane protein
MSALIFSAGLALFFGSHLFAAFRRRGEGDLPSRHGPARYRMAFSVVSAVGIVLVALGYAALRPVAPILYEPGPGVKHAALALMPVAFILVAAAYAPAGHIRRFVGGHPMLAGIKLWAIVHVAANGDLASLVLFLSFLAFGVIDRIAQKRRAKPALQASIVGDGVAVLAGLLGFAAFAAWLHPVLFGVVVLP